MSVYSWLHWLVIVAHLNNTTVACLVDLGQHMDILHMYYTFALVCRESKWWVNGNTADHLLVDVQIKAASIKKNFPWSFMLKTVALPHYELDWCTYLILVHLPERWSSKPRCVAETTRCNPPPFTSGPSPHCFHGDSHNWSLKIAHKSSQLIQKISFLSIYHPTPHFLLYLFHFSFALFFCATAASSEQIGPTSGRASVSVVNTGGWNGDKTKKMMLHNWETQNIGHIYMIL